MFSMNTCISFKKIMPTFKTVAGMWLTVNELLKVWLQKEW